MRTSVTRTAVVVILAMPGHLEAQCAIDLIEAGVQAYRALELDAAQEFLRIAIDENGRDSSLCATENARALTYLGAAYLLDDRPESATRAFERAVIHAPRFRPDELEFPPAVTDVVDRVRRDTPAVAVMLSEEAAIGPRADEALLIRLTASTDHEVAVTVRSSDGAAVRTVYRGRVAAGARGTSVEWDGRTFAGRTVDSGSYDLEVVSLDGRSQPVRKVMIGLVIESEAPSEPAPSDTVGLSLRPLPESSGSTVWRAIAIGGAGLLAGAIAVGLPHAVDGSEGSWVRYPVAGSLGLAGVIGFFQRLSDDGRQPARDFVEVVRVEAGRGPSAPATLRIRSGRERRIELREGAAGVGVDSSGDHSPSAT